MSVSSVSSNSRKNTERIREQQVQSIKQRQNISSQSQSSKSEKTSTSQDEVKISHQASSVNVGFKSEALSKERIAELEEDMAAQDSEEGGSVSVSEQTTIADESDQESQAPFTMTDASSYEDGSDVKELAYKMVESRDRAEADLSEISVLKASDANNEIHISKGEDGGIIVNVDGKEKEFSAEEARNLIIDGSDGNDKIIADKDVEADLQIVGGLGNDTITTAKGNDTVYDNYGANNISTKDGSDTIIANQLDYIPGEHSQTTVDNRGFFRKLFDKITGKSSYEEQTVDGNIIDGGDGDDYIEGGLGNDYIRGGSGDDVIYGLNGDDIIRAEGGDDYVDGGKGNDDINVGSGNNIAFGGNGDDIIKAGSGDNVMVGGRGSDSIKVGEGKNKITADSADKVRTGENSQTSYVESIDIPENITVNAIHGSTFAPVTGNNGNMGFTERVQSDLASLAALSTGQTMLNALEANGKSVNIVDTDAGNYCSYYQEGATLKEDGSASYGSDSTVAYNRTRTLINSDGWGKRPPIVGMYHEMSHSYDAGAGILDGRYFNYDGTQAENADNGGVKAAELQAVGLGDVSDDVQMNPEGISENALRKALNLERRDKY